MNIRGLLALIALCGALAGCASTGSQSSTDGFVRSEVRARGL